jgi:hypothetical protein
VGRIEPVAGERDGRLAVHQRADQHQAAQRFVYAAGVRSDGGMRIVDVWESEEAYNGFREARLMPAVKEVLGEVPDQPPDIEIYELHHLVKP